VTRSGNTRISQFGKLPTSKGQSSQGTSERQDKAGQRPYERSRPGDKNDRLSNKSRSQRGIARRKAGADGRTSVEGQASRDPYWVAETLFSARSPPSRLAIAIVE